MAAVFQCDACKKVSTKAGEVFVEKQKHELCQPCLVRIGEVLAPKKRGRPAAEDAGG